jgi:hypothetical protein
VRHLLLALLCLFYSFPSSSPSCLVTGLPCLVEVRPCRDAAVLLLRRLGCCASRCANPTAVLLLLLCCSCCSCYCLYWPRLLLPWPCQCLPFLLDSCSVLLFMLLCLPVTHMCSCMLPWLTAVSDSCYLASTSAAWLVIRDCWLMVGSALLNCGPYTSIP